MSGTGSRKRVLATGSAVVMATAAVVFAAGGGLDTSFGTGGVVIQSPDANGNRTLNFMSVAVQADHRIVVAGVDTRTGASKWAVRRFLESGSPDTSFGTGGLVALFGDVNNSDRATDVAVDGSGRIYVAGSVCRIVSQTKKKTTYEYDMAAARLNPDGSLDTTWATGGKAVLAVNSGVVDGGNNPKVCLALQSDGKLLVAGPDIAGSAAVGAVTRLQADGALDKTYAGAGTFLYSGFNCFRSVALDSSGRLVAAGVKSGTPSSQYCVVRFTAAGAVDASFPKRVVNDDFAATVAQAIVYCVAVQGDGAVVVSGSGTINGQSDAFVARYGATGQVDAGFGASGLVATGVANTLPRGLAVQADGKILLGASNSAYGIQTSQTVLRYLASGALDSSFGTGGVSDNALFDSSVTSLNIMEMALDPDGRIVLAGNGTRPPSAQQTSGGALVRYLGN